MTLWKTVCDLKVCHHAGSDIVSHEPAAALQVSLMSTTFFLRNRLGNKNVKKCSQCVTAVSWRYLKNMCIVFWKYLDFNSCAFLLLIITKCMLRRYLSCIHKYRIPPDCSTGCLDQFLRGCYNWNFELKILVNIFKKVLCENRN